MITCFDCGAAVHDDNDRCPVCGAAVHATDEEQAAAHAAEAARADAARKGARESVAAMDRTADRARPWWARMWSDLWTGGSGRPPV